MIFVDSTYADVTAYGFALYVVMIRNEYDRGVPISFIITEKDDTESLIKAFDVLKLNGVNPGVAMMDKDLKIKAAILHIWEHAITLLCWFHVAQAVQRWISKRKSGISGKKNIETRRRVMQLLNELKMCRTESEFTKTWTLVTKELTDISTAVVEYLETYWLPCATMWACFGRQVNHEYSNTSNIAE